MQFTVKCSISDIKDEARIKRSIARVRDGIRSEPQYSTDEDGDLFDLYHRAAAGTKLMIFTKNTLSLIEYLC